MSYQKTTIVGNVGTKPEMKYSQSGQAITNFSVAVNEQYTNGSGEKIKRTLWFRVATFGKQAETCNQYLDKGSLVLVEGRMTADPATGSPKIFTKKDGSASTSFEITAQTVRFLSSRSTTETAEELGGQVSELPQEDEFPF